MKYYYILIDKLEKTISLREYESPESCYAREMKKVQIEYNLQKFHIWQIEKRFIIFHNDIKDFIDYETIYKYAKKYKVVE